MVQPALGADVLANHHVTIEAYAEELEGLIAEIERLKECEKVFTALNL